MVKRKWTANPVCQFCPESESIHHLFFQCSATKFVCAQTIPGFFSHYFDCIAKFIGSSSRNIQIVGLAAIWKIRLATSLF